MKSYTSEKIRNVALLGHGGCGKTTFAEAALLTSGAISKAGKVESGNTVSDYDKMEIERGSSINTSIIPVEWKGTKINFIDTPGDFDFVGEVTAALRACEAAMIVVDAGSGIQVGTEMAWKACEKYGVPRFFVINKRDKDEFDFDKTLGELQDMFGPSVAPLALPINADIDDDLKEAIASTDEELLDKYFEEGDLTEDEIKTGLANGIASGDIVPVLQSIFQVGQGVDDILDAIDACVPNPMMHAPYKTEDGEVEPSKDAPLSSFVFKTIIDPFVGKISIIKVVSGKLAAASEVYNANSEKPEKVGKVFYLRGKEQIDTPAAETGDIAAVAKLQFTQSGDTLCDKANVVKFAPIPYPQATYFIAVEAADKNDEDKMGTGLNRLHEEDPSFVVERNVETHQTLLGGQGDKQLGIIQTKLKDRFGVTVNVIPQKIAYRETIKGNSDVEGKHKKQSGGAGQFGDVFIKFSPSDQDFEFAEEIFGGSVPKNYIPAVEKGLQECMEKGPLAGCKVQGVKAVLYDGKYHPVDSNEVSFKIAASLAFKKGIVEANPCLLEPIMKLEILVPDDFMGDVMGDLNGRRGQITGMETRGGAADIQAFVPLSEMFGYATNLRGRSQGRGQFSMEPSHYTEVPKSIAEKLINSGRG